MKATKGNREYIIEESQVKAYQGCGFDVKDDDGNVIAYGKGKIVPYETYAAVLKEKEILLNRVGDLEAENSALRKLVETTEEKPKETGKRESKKAGE